MSFRGSHGFSWTAYLFFRERFKLPFLKDYPSQEMSAREVLKNARRGHCWFFIEDALLSFHCKVVLGLRSSSTNKSGRLINFIFFIFSFIQAYVFLKNCFLPSRDIFARLSLLRGLSKPLWRFCSSLKFWGVRRRRRRTRGRIYIGSDNSKY